MFKNEISYQYDCYAKHTLTKLHPHAARPTLLPPYLFTVQLITLQSN